MIKKEKYPKTDFEVIYTKGSGPGGQHRNKVETACTIKHIPSGTRQSCQASRSKLTNYETAMKVLISKLEVISKSKKHEDLNNIRRDKIWDESKGVSNTVRTYNLTRNEVKDHRSGKVANAKDFLNGKIDITNISR